MGLAFGILANRTWPGRLLAFSEAQLVMIAFEQ